VSERESLSVSERTSVSESVYVCVAKFTTVTPLSLIISCKLSFLIVGLNVSSLHTLALKSPKNVHMVIREFIEYMV
jgi:hypothetical protein